MADDLFWLGRYIERAWFDALGGVATLAVEVSVLESPAAGPPLPPLSGPGPV